ncbi:acyltransferase family protein [Pseudoduganella namucuonensis]|uniref:Peptidoglycan/LPS O-acetylase OafA/YrhL, contains acyltransferase and SGNH-hydrolase domains n=1 Tax=Pseudoduganella namucuonensis TaxID=1035707 RepID=A0A1I7GDR1_9BURK|nr:acyltransferase [Pseudoduganella namucuonensis]SFU46580.1 Peptidoglycan/LPS O-acetylase OafA/YrhL, contains acyltransferase and SGNH-hydrolase domains [Pseudoduganella namucuonensis]
MSKPDMTPALYLNLLRFLAAFAVYIYHAGHFAGVRVPFFGNFGSHAVIVFFVLSGLVIAYSTGSKHQDGVDFAIARLARLWSVVLPALLLTLVLDTVGQIIAPAAYTPMQPYSAFKWAASIVANSLFLNQIWSLSIWPGTNGPFWSLSYEFWYYALFGAACYFRGWKRVAVVGAAAAIAGPKILVAMPIWLLGVLLYRHLKPQSAGAGSAGWAIWALSLVAAVCYTLLGAHDTLTAVFPRLSAWATSTWAVNFVPESYAIGLIVSAHILGFAWASTRLPAPSKALSNRVRIIADTSFGLYLFHYPALYFTKALMWCAEITEGLLYVEVVYALPFAMSTVLALYCEKLKRSFTGYLNAGARRMGWMPRQALGV